MTARYSEYGVLNYGTNVSSKGGYLNGRTYNVTVRGPIPFSPILVWFVLGIELYLGLPLASLFPALK